ncbi:MAG TPA: hypothetical protein VK306_08000 [Acidimicrobiales bacterium]|nr:hypothetical protein [Acidimicrobiales bacterium]
MPVAAVLVVASMPGAEAVAGVRADQRADAGEVLEAAVRRAWGVPPTDDQGRVGDAFASGEGELAAGGGQLGTPLMAGAASPSDIPEVALRAYVRAAAALQASDPSCHLRWSLLAAIGRVESNHGRSGGSVLDEAGDGSRPIRGLPLDGRAGVARVGDTDDGALDGDRVNDRAVGPMQIIPSTWRRVAADGDEDGDRDPDNMFDATLAAGVYLCAGDTDLGDPDQLEAAVLRYNRSPAYLDAVLRLAAAYERGEAGTLPDAGPVPGGVPHVDRPIPGPANLGAYPPWLRSRTFERRPDRPTGSTGGEDAGPTTPPGTPTTTVPPEPVPTIPPPPATPAPPQPGPTIPPRPPLPPPCAAPAPAPATADTAAVEAVAGLVSGELPSGSFSLQVSGTPSALCLRLVLPAASPAAEDTPAHLAQQWRVSSADGRHVVWGYTPADVTQLLVTVAGGQTGGGTVVTVPTVPTSVAGVDGRGFAAALPAGATIQAIDGRRADGTVALVGADVAGAVGAVAGFAPDATAVIGAAPPA